MRFAGFFPPIFETLVEPDRLIEIAYTCVDAMRSHMSKEEGEVFPLAKLLLIDADWHEIDAALKAKADPLFGQVVDDNGNRHSATLWNVTNRDRQRFRFQIFRPGEMRDRHFAYFLSE